jgi:hypothetical protein
MLPCVDERVLCDMLKPGMELLESRPVGKAGGADEGGASKDPCEERPPILCSPQNGASSRELVVVYVGLVGAVFAGAVLGNGNSSTGIVLWVLYPSGTLFLTRMPTVSSEDCVAAGIGGDMGEI